MFVELYREEKREGGDRGGLEDKRGEWKGERQIQPITSSLSVLLHLEHTEIHRVGGGRRQRRPGGEKGESKGGEREVKPVISLSDKNGTEDWVFEGTKLITNTKKQRLKI